ncbi:MAG: dephospho-CoA kinase [Oscillospiraceae bacterium]|nr:dephospho-CoA kinase [Oscillospiraceae bacterium]
MIGNAYTVGLTGQSGAGKTTAARVFAENGFGVIDCDIIAREAVLPSSPAPEELSREFGSEIITPSGTLDRKRLGEIVFSDKERLKRLDCIIYPHINRLIADHAERLSSEGKKYILLDAPTLFEAGADKLCDLIVAVTADEEIRLERIMKRDGITAESAKKRFSSQHDESFFYEKADYVIRNGGTDEQLVQRTEELCRRIMHRE